MNKKKKEKGNGKKIKNLQIIIQMNKSFVKML